MSYSIKGKGKAVARKRRHQRVRKHVSGTAQRPRLVVFRSNRNVVAQVIDDTVGHTLAAASTVETEVRKQGGKKVDQALLVGKLLAGRAQDAGVSAVVFDRGGYKYHGRVAAVAEGAREAGLNL